MELLIPIAATLLCSAVGLVVLIAGFLRRSRKKKRLGLILFLSPWLMWVVIGIISPGIDEWNPQIESNAAIIGRWKGDGYEIDLKPDSSYTLSSNGNQTIGRWKRNDWGLNLTAEDHSVRDMRFVEDGGHLLLLPEPPELDPGDDPGPIMKRE